MSFLYPYVLLGLVVPVLLGIGMVVLSTKRRKNWQQLVSAQHRENLVRETPVWRSAIPAIALLLSLAFCIIAAARPFNGYKNAEASLNGRNLIITLDISRSMETRDVAPSRLDTARSAAQMLIDALPTDKIGLMIFSGEAELTVPLTYDHTALQETLNRVNRDWESYGGTNLEQVLRLAMQDFERTAPEGTNALVIISDGEDTVEFSPELLSEARKKNLLVITVGVGTINGGPIPDENNENGLWLDADNKHVISKLQPEMLKRLAVETNGDFYHMNGSTNLTAFAQSAAEKLNRHEEKFSVNKAPNDLFAYFAGAALLMLMAGIVLATQWKRMPAKLLRLPILLVFACMAQPLQAAPAEEALEAYRNALAAEKEGKTEEAQAALSQALLDSDPKMQSAAMLALGNMNTREVFSQLRKLYMSEEETALPTPPSVEQLEDIIKKLEACKVYFNDALTMQPDCIPAKNNISKIDKLIEDIKKEIERLKQQQQESDQQQDGDQQQRHRPLHR
ncbi:MAG: VWA domain-containing protein, partial [Akkermansia sp.]|nr:VWA domain-containing protein [Akkermansia sp.]